jgi:hypothetical protein
MRVIVSDASEKKKPDTAVGQGGFDKDVSLTGDGRTIRTKREMLLPRRNLLSHARKYVTKAIGVRSP